MEAGRMARNRGCIANRTWSRTPAGLDFLRKSSRAGKCDRSSEGYPAAGACPQHVPEELWADHRGDERSAARAGSSATHAPNVQRVKACFQKVKPQPLCWGFLFAGLTEVARTDRIAILLRVDYLRPSCGLPGAGFMPGPGLSPFGLPPIAGICPPPSGPTFGLPPIGFPG
jgi:hypothetical protein